MSQELDNILHSVSMAASTCYDLNGDMQLTTEEQTVFYQFAEHIIFLLGDMHANYDALSDKLAGNPAAATELTVIWVAANTALEDFSRSATSPKMRTAVATTAFAIDRTSSIMQAILN